MYGPLPEPKTIPLAISPCARAETAADRSSTRPMSAWKAAIVIFDADFKAGCLNGFIRDTKDK